MMEKSKIDGEKFRLVDDEIEYDELDQEQEWRPADGSQKLWHLSKHVRHEEASIDSWYDGRAYCHRCDTTDPGDYFLTYPMGTATILCYKCCMELRKWLGKAFRIQNACPTCGFETNCFGGYGINSCIFGHKWRESKEVIVHKHPLTPEEVHEILLNTSKTCECDNCIEERRKKREEEHLKNIEKKREEEKAKEENEEEEPNPMSSWDGLGGKAGED